MNERDRLVAAIHLAMRAGEVRPEMSPEELADALYAHGITPPLHLRDEARPASAQRDRLAAVLHESICFGVLRHETGDPPADGQDYRWADALLARGVRVVDVETLAAALRYVYGFQVAPDPVAQARQDAEWVLAALDRDPTDE